MPTSYTSLLGLALPVTGELSGTWGDTVNQYITQYLDASVAGAQIISGSQTAVTLSPTNGSSLVQAGSGSTGSSQYGIIRCTGNPAGTLTVTVSYSTLTNAQFSKSYLVINATSTSQSVIVRATTSSGTSSGVTLASGESAVIAWNGSDFVKVASSAVDGVSTFSAGTTGFTPSTATSGAVTLAGTLATTNGGTGLASFTANRVFYSSSTSAIGSSANLTFDGTTLTAANFTDSSLTSGRVTYATAGGNLTDSANLTFDGTNLGVGTSSPGTYGKVVSSGGTISLVTDTAAQRRLSFWSTANGNSENGYIQVQNDGVTTNTGEILFATKNSGGTLAERARITAAGFTQPVAYADTVSALGNTGTATTINLQNANVFTATLTGNCTFTLSNPIATGSSSFTLILTNDGTAGRTVAWSGGAFRFPGGAASLSRTTTANAVDIWVFFTPNGGTTWYGSIPMKNMTA